ncbi:hypothetical protein [Nonomuraea cavernae]|uniref:Uncharacterized protein n=1 Tax=Nonomuraea cavernae TaxID=2045107 RepID=A0A917ZHC9_9ACTN|nr:hypothetical protein [Nonomuraea cavernae]MCA2189694.1 hypothetical protein [Nonomuraea cavernae]GGO83080.1 hypothetical protein GCM10012289_75800 [Nonomuraea cavernae]
MFPGAHAQIAYPWTPPFAREGLCRRLWTGPSHVNEFVEAIEREGQWEADQLRGAGRIAAWAAPQRCWAAFPT